MAESENLPDETPSVSDRSGLLWRLPRLPALALPLGGLLLIVGGAILLLREKTPGFLKSQESCLLTVPAADGVFVLDRSLHFSVFRESPCEPGPLLRTGEGNHRQILDVPEFREFIREWRSAVEQYPDLPERLSEIRLSRTKDTIFFSRNGRLKIEVSQRESHRWAHTLHAVLVTAEAKGWTEGFVDLKDEDGLYIRSHSPP